MADKINLAERALRIPFEIYASGGGSMTFIGWKFATRCLVRGGVIEDRRGRFPRWCGNGKKG